MEHDDLLERVNHAHMQILHELRKAYRPILRRASVSQTTSPTTPTVHTAQIRQTIERLTLFPKKFPTTIEEFKRLDGFPENQLRVARFLCAQSDAERDAIFTEAADSIWEKADTGPLRKTFSSQVSDIQG